MPSSSTRKQKVRASKYLRIKKVDHLCRRLKLSRTELDRILASKDLLYRLQIVEKNGKERELSIPAARLKTPLKQLNRVLQNLKFPEYVHGGMPGCSQITNARRHVNSPTILTADIKDFFPSISQDRVRTMFYRRLQCSREVAQILSDLTTYRDQIPQGAPTSTTVATLVAEHLAYRLKGLAAAHGGRFTQYVDDMTISGPVHLESLKKTVERIFEDEGFVCHPDKLCVVGRTEEQVVTGIRVNNGIDVSQESLAKVDQELRKAIIDGASGLYPSDDQFNSLQGKIEWVRQLNRGIGNNRAAKLKKLRAKAGS